MNRVPVQANVLRWACMRSGKSIATLEQKTQLGRLGAWLEGIENPTLKQLQIFSNATHTPIGYFFLSEPPEDLLPLPDLRTVGNRTSTTPSPDLLETLYICQQRQEWFRNFARMSGIKPLGYVGSVSLKHPVAQVADTIRSKLGFSLEARRAMSTWSDALRTFVDMAENAGTLVMKSGIVGSNTHRSLNVQEFRGFALSDPSAPLVFINGKDSLAAQMFTLAHELAHIWLGESALSDVGPGSFPSHKIELWCNAVAAEVLVPLEDLVNQQMSETLQSGDFVRLSRRYKVSTLVIIRRLHDAGILTRDQMWKVYREAEEQIQEKSKAGGGNFYNTTKSRVSKTFARAVIISTLEGHTLHRDAFRMLGVKKLSTFRELGSSLGVPA